MIAADPQRLGLAANLAALVVAAVFRIAAQAVVARYHLWIARPAALDPPTAHPARIALQIALCRSADLGSCRPASVVLPRYYRLIRFACPVGSAACLAAEKVSVRPRH